MQIRNSQFLLGDCLEIMPTLPAGSVDMVVTSPPYDDLRDYGHHGSVFNFRGVAREIARVLRPGGVLVWNVNDRTRDGAESLTSFRQALYFADECGLKLADTMIYKKANPGGARGSNKTYIQCFEYMFVFSKGPLSTFNLICDRPNKRPGAQKGAGRRNKDGSLEKTKGYVSAETGRRFNVWEIPTEQNGNPHPAPFPVALARDHILSWTNPGDLVLDPFGGSGTTAVAAERSGRRSICIERDETYYWSAVARLLGGDE